MNTSKVTDNTGKVIEVSDLGVPASKIYNFVQIHKQSYFEDHSLDWALDEILTRGMAEITRTVKTAKKLREDKAAGSLLKGFNLTPKQAQDMLAKMLAEQAAKAQADATK